MSVLASVTLPEFGGGSHLPPLPLEEYRSRIARTTERLADLDLDVLVVYADREHAANLEYLTGFDPRFEEAVLLLHRSGQRLLLAGNECMGYLPDEALGIPAELLQELSLLGQPRGQSRTLRQIFSSFGIRRGTRVGCAGWKYFGDTLGEDAAHALEIPAYLVDLLRTLTGDAALVTNATALFMDPTRGLRIENSAAQIARFEYAAVHASNAITAAVRRLRPGIEERDVEREFHTGGLPLSCHSMVSFGDKARRGLASPSDRRAELGDTFTMALGLKGALSCRAGAIAGSAEDLPAALRAFYPRFASHYFDIVTTWYERVAVGARAGDVVAAVDGMRDDDLFRFAVNPGHYLHLDEWVHSPFVAGSDVVLQSGAVLQMDIIPISRGPFCYINAEDGVVLADAALRQDIARVFPEMWARMQARRQFMQQALGLALDDSVLPLSNAPGWLPPYALSSGAVFVRGR